METHWSGSSDFSAADIFLEEVDDAEEDFPAREEWDGVWKVTVVADGETLAMDKYPELWKARARAQDFERLFRKNPNTKVHRHYLV